MDIDMYNTPTEKVSKHKHHQQFDLSKTLGKHPKS